MRKRCRVNSKEKAYSRSIDWSVPRPTAGKARGVLEFSSMWVWQKPREQGVEWEHMTWHRSQITHDFEGQGEGYDFSLSVKATQEEVLGRESVVSQAIVWKTESLTFLLNRLCMSCFSFSSCRGRRRHTQTHEGKTRQRMSPQGSYFHAMLSLPEGNGAK